MLKSTTRRRSTTTYIVILTLLQLFSFTIKKTSCLITDRSFNKGNNNNNNIASIRNLTVRDSYYTRILQQSSAMKRRKLSIIKGKNNSALYMLQSPLSTSTNSFIWSILRGGAATTAISTSNNVATAGATTNGFIAGCTTIVNFIGERKGLCYVMLFFTILFESYATALSKKAKDTGSISFFLRAIPFYVGCMLFFNIALAQMDISVAYALWSSMGSILVTTIGVVYFGESFGFKKLIFLAMITLGVVGLNLR